MSFNLVRVKDLDPGRLRRHRRRRRHPVNPSAFVIHSKIHELNPAAEAAAHATPPTRGRWARWAAAGAAGPGIGRVLPGPGALRRLRAVDRDRAGPDIAEKLGDKRAILLRHHGLITVGGSIEEAVHWFFTYDSCAQVQLLAGAAGTPHVMDHEQATAAKAGFGDRQLGWFSFQLLYDEITAAHPELLDE
ncbi:class II aldolase/adducin family protein [Saccharothrix sp. MB29]|nr:class II aldolase/adducin family protein [Saccharothrix sp. MB29]